MAVYLVDIGTSGVRGCAIDDEEVERGYASARSLKQRGESSGASSYPVST